MLRKIELWLMLSAFCASLGVSILVAYKDKNFLFKAGYDTAGMGSP